MNALTAVRANATGLLSPTPAERQAALKQVWSTLRANLLGRTTKAETLVKAEAVEKESTVPRELDQELGRDAFLDLLLAQLRYQDPLQPIDNTEMVAQLAEFSALEQMTRLNEGFEALQTDINQLNFISASALLGRQVSGISLDGLPLAGMIELVQMEEGRVMLTVDGQRMPLANVIGVQ